MRPGKNSSVAGHGVAMTLLVTAATLSGCGMTSELATRNSLPASVPSVPVGAELSTARTAFEAGNFGYAARYFELAAEASPESIDACLGLAASYDWLYRFDLSDRAYETCRETGEDAYIYHNNVGFSHLLRGEYGLASVSFARAEALKPGDPVVRTNLEILRDVSSG